MVCLEFTYWLDGECGQLRPCLNTIFVHYIRERTNVWNEATGSYREARQHLGDDLGQRVQRESVVRHEDRTELPKGQPVAGSERLPAERLAGGGSRGGSVVAVDSGSAQRQRRQQLLDQDQELEALLLQRHARLARLWQYAQRLTEEVNHARSERDKLARPVAEDAD